MPKNRGKQADPKDTLKCVAAIILAQNARKKRKSIKAEDTPHLVSTDRARRKQEISKHDIAKHWELAFNDNVKPSSIDSKLKTVRRILPCYLAFLKSGKALHAGIQVLDSPEIRRAMASISKLEPTVAKKPEQLFSEPGTTKPATLNPFAVPLRYQSSNHEVVYRNQARGAGNVASLDYTPKVATPTSKKGSLLHTRAGKITLTPDISIKEHYRVGALIDRIAIIVELARSVSSSSLRSIIAAETGTPPFVYDFLDISSEKPEWGVPLTEPDAGKLVGHPYAIMIQNPTPALLASVIHTISDSFGMETPGLLHLVEVSVDFYPRDGSLPVHERIPLRERMVGILQRHHWIRAAELYDPKLPVQRYADARQMLNKDSLDPDSGPKIRFLFATDKKREDANTRNTSDSEIVQSQIRGRVLTTNPGYDLYLNSTLVKGGRCSPVQISIQQKFADERNRKKSTMRVLSDEERRARIEVSLSGTEALQQRGLHKVSDLGAINFRKLTKGTLTFKLPEIEPFEHLMEDAKAQLRTRGVYGIDLRTRALHLEKREQLRSSGQKLPRNQEREGMALKDWTEMNKVVGAALDGLTRRWKGFTAP